MPEIEQTLTNSFTAHSPAVTTSRIFEMVKKPRNIVAGTVVALAAAGAAFFASGPSEAQSGVDGIAKELKDLRVDKLNSFELNNLGIRSFNNVQTGRLGTFEVPSPVKDAPGCYSVVAGGGGITPINTVKPDGTPVFESTQVRVCLTKDTPSGP